MANMFKAKDANGSVHFFPVKGVSEVRVQDGGEIFIVLNSGVSFSVTGDIAEELLRKMSEEK